jgi:hypothetical protein
MRKARKRLQSRLRRIATIFTDLDPDDVTRFIDDEAWRKSILKVLGKHRIEVVAEFEAFLQAALKESKRRSGKTGAFHEYAKNLDIILDLLTAFDCEDFPPALLAATVRNFDRLAGYIGDRRGDSFAAKRVWDERKGELSEAMVAELNIIARQHLYGTLRVLLKDMQ